VRDKAPATIPASRLLIHFRRLSNPHRPIQPDSPIRIQLRRGGFMPPVFVAIVEA